MLYYIYPSIINNNKKTQKIKILPDLRCGKIIKMTAKI